MENIYFLLLISIINFEKKKDSSVFPQHLTYLLDDKTQAILRWPAFDLDKELPSLFSILYSHDNRRQLLKLRKF